MGNNPANRGSGSFLAYYSRRKGGLPLPSCILLLLLLLLSSSSTTTSVHAIIESTELRRAAAGIAAGIPLYQDDRLLFWSSYEFNIDAALQQLGPLADLFLVRGGGDEGDDDEDQTAKSATATLIRPDDDDDDDGNTEPSEQRHYHHVRGTINTTSSSIQQHHATSTTAVNVSEQEGLTHITPVSQLVSRPKVPNNNNDDNDATAVLATATATPAELLRVNYTLFQEGDGSAQDPDGIPTRFLLMHNGDRAAAQTSLQATLEWRDEHNIDDILNQPQTKFDICKTIFPHFFLGRDVQGGYVVFVQRPARLDLERGLQNNLTPEDVLFHYVFVNEYLWQVIEKESSLATMISIIDLQGLHLGVLRKPDIISFVKRFVSTIDSYYPRSAHKTLLLNAPRWFSTLYKLISPLLRETTKAKIQILTRSKQQDEALQSVLGQDSATMQALPASFWSSWKPHHHKKWKWKHAARRHHNNKRRRKHHHQEEGEEEPQQVNGAAALLKTRKTAVMETNNIKTRRSILYLRRMVWKPSWENL